MDRSGAVLTKPGDPPILPPDHHHIAGRHAMRRWIAVALTTAGSLAAIAAAALVTGAEAAPASTTSRQADPGPAYVLALDTAEGWATPSPAQYATDLATGRQICDMLAHGWNQAGVVANMLTWPANRDSQEQLAVAVRVTHDRLCGQNA